MPEAPGRGERAIGGALIPGNLSAYGLHSFTPARVRWFVLMTRQSTFARRHQVGPRRQECALAAAVIWVSFLGWTAPQAARAQAKPSVAPDAAVSDSAATLAKYCTGCHNQRVKTA